MKHSHPTDQPTGSRLPAVRRERLIWTVSGSSDDERGILAVCELGLCHLTNIYQLSVCVRVCVCVCVCVCVLVIKKLCLSNSFMSFSFYGLSSVCSAEVLCKVWMTVCPQGCVKEGKKHRSVKQPGSRRPSSCPGMDTPSTSSPALTKNKYNKASVWISVSGGVNIVFTFSLHINMFVTDSVEV